MHDTRTGVSVLCKKKARTQAQDNPSGTGNRIISDFFSRSSSYIICNNHHAGANQEANMLASTSSIRETDTQKRRQYLVDAVPGPKMRLVRKAIAESQQRSGAAARRFCGSQRLHAPTYTSAATATALTLPPPQPQLSNILPRHIGLRAAFRRRFSHDPLPGRGESSTHQQHVVGKVCKGKRGCYRANSCADAFGGGCGRCRLLPASLPTYLPAWSG